MKNLNSKLNKRVEERFHNIYSMQMNVIVEDATGGDKAVQEYFFRMGYQNVSAYASQGKAKQGNNTRNNIRS